MDSAGNLYIQGDICIIPVEVNHSDKGKSYIVENGVIAQGTATGHKHKAENANLYVISGDMYLEAYAEAKIVHEEHATITLPIGTYKVIRQREWQPNGWRTVSD